MATAQVHILPVMKNTIVVVDDQSTGRAILEQVVRGLDERVVVQPFARPVDAVVWATKHVADLVLVDYSMPDMDGIEFVKRLRALPGYEHVPMVMVTVHDDRKIRYAALDAGITDFLIKPIDARECLARCRNLITLRRQQLALEDRKRLPRLVGFTIVILDELLVRGVPLLKEHVVGHLHRAGQPRSLLRGDNLFPSLLGFVELHPLLFQLGFQFLHLDSHLSSLL